jgi:hypothetical protein
LRHIVDNGRGLLANEEPGQALFLFLRFMVLQWGAADRGLSETLAGLGIDIKSAMPDAEEAFLAVLRDLLVAAQDAGTVRRDLDVRDLKALLVGAQAMQSYNAEAAERLTEVVLDGLRAG